MKGFSRFLRLCMAGVVIYSVQAAEVMDAKSAKLLAVLQEFAKENKVSDEELQEALGKIFLKGVKFQKGGVGIINENIFVLLREKQNTLLINDREWKGQVASDQEIVITDGQNTKSIGKINVNKSVVVVFSPGEIQFVDLSTGDGGKYIR